MTQWPEKLQFQYQIFCTRSKFNFFENLLGDKMSIVDYWLTGSSKTLFDHSILLSGLDNPYFDTEHSI